jgi:hypothetical protein
MLQPGSKTRRTAMSPNSRIPPVVVPDPDSTQGARPPAKRKGQGHDITARSDQNDAGAAVARGIWRGGARCGSNRYRPTCVDRGLGAGPAERNLAVVIRLGRKGDRRCRHARHRWRTGHRDSEHHAAIECRARLRVGRRLFPRSVPARAPDRGAVHVER